MSHEENEEQIEDDPRIANIYRRMRLIVGVSMLLMAAGFFAVFGVIVYRLTATASDAAAAQVFLDIPAEARLVSMTADGGRLFLAVESNGLTRVHVLQAAQLKAAGTLDLEPSALPVPPTQARPAGGGAAVPRP